MGSGLRILFTDTKRWAVGVRAGMVFAKLGCEVAMLCPSEGHPAHTVDAIRHRFAYNGFTPLESLRRAIRSFRPHLILPTCDRGVNHLHRLHAQAQARNEHEIAAAIERSLGPPSAYPVVSNRYELLKLAHEEGILIPETMALRGEDDLRRADRLGLPLVIKSDGTWGGSGVAVARNQREIRPAYFKLRGRRGIAWLIKELALNRDRGNTLNDWRSFNPTLIAQSWVDGCPANCVVACWEGKVLAGIAVKVVSSRGERGPATVVEIVAGPEMLRAAERIARRLNLSGFFGLDFMIERNSGTAYMIEMNPRCTQACSLELGTGRNLPVAMCARLAGVPEPITQPVTTLRHIAYFPKPAATPGAGQGIPEWSYYYDVPPDVPEFIERLIYQWNDRSLPGRWFDRMRGIAREPNRAAMRPLPVAAQPEENRAAQAKVSEPRQPWTGTD